MSEYNAKYIIESNYGLQNKSYLESQEDRTERMLKETFQIVQFELSNLFIKKLIFAYLYADSKVGKKGDPRDLKKIKSC